MISVEEVIRIYIKYKGYRQGLFTDYGSAFDDYLKYYEVELKTCDLFETSNREYVLAIRYKNNKFVIYSTDERATLWGVEYIYENEKDAADKYIELYHLTRILHKN